MPRFHMTLDSGVVAGLIATFHTLVDSVSVLHYALFDQIYKKKIRQKRTFLGGMSHFSDER